MLRIEIIKKDNIIKQINFYGHANYDDYGKDIVCAAASATMICTANAIISIDESAIRIKQEKNIQTINILKKDIIIDKLINNMVECFKSLEQKYPKNIEIK